MHTPAVSLCRVVAITALFSITVATSSAAAEEALVLSGGGARGLAHAGVVLGVDERGHDPGIVVGTSMGSIVGAMYAAGYSGREIRAILESEDWRRIFTPFPFEVGPWRDPRYPVFRFDVSSGSGFGPRGAITDWRINRRLVQILFEPAARARGDFDRLPRRFRSVTADAETGAMVSIGSGDLARSVRASMAAPGFFAPIRWDLPNGNRLLTDGGVADYLPVAEARRLGASLVVASDVMIPNHPLKSGDALTIARRTTELLTVHARREPVPPDILVVPEIDPTLEEFHYPSDPAPVIEDGRRTALKAIPPASDSTSGPRTPQPEPASLAALVVEPGSGPEPDRRLDAFLARAFRDAAPGRFQPERILAVVDRLYTTGLFDGLWPSVERADSLSGSAPDGSDSSSASMSDAAPILRVRSEPRPFLSVSGSVGYDNDRGGRGWGALRRLDAVRATPYEITLAASANGVEQWGSVEGRITSLLLGASAWTLGARFGETEIRFASAPRDGGDLEVNRAGVWAGFEARSLRSDLHASAGVRSEQISSDFGPDGGSTGPWLRVRKIGPMVEVLGTAPELDTEIRFGDVPYRRARVKGSVARTWGWLDGALVGDAAVVGGDAPLDAAPSMGGEGLIPALRDGERRGRARAVAGVDLTLHTRPISMLRLRARGGVVADESRPERGLLYSREKLWMAGVRLSGLWWTVFGRLEAGLDANTLGDRRAIVDLGTQF